MQWIYSIVGLFIFSFSYQAYAQEPCGEFCDLIDSNYSSFPNDGTYHTCPEEFTYCAIYYEFTYQDTSIQGIHYCHKRWRYYGFNPDENPFDDPERVEWRIPRYIEVSSATDPECRPSGPIPVADDQPDNGGGYSDAQNSETVNEYMLGNPEALSGNEWQITVYLTGGGGGSRPVGTCTYEHYPNNWDIDDCLSWYALFYN